MATGRTVSKWLRVYVGGYDLSGYSRNIGPLAQVYDAVGEPAATDAIKGYLPNHVTLGLGTLNGIFDNTATSGLHELHSAGAGARHVVTAALGVRAAPAQGDAVYCGEFEQKEYIADPNSGMVFATLPFAPTSEAAATLAYDRPWGVLLLPATAQTAVNTATGVDDNGAATAFGGYMGYHILAGNGTATLKVQDAATNLDASFSDLSGATTGSLTMTAGLSGIVALGKTATVRQFLRWQLVFGTGTTLTAFLSFSRALR